MPNLRGPYEEERRLYAWVLYSVLLYGAPVWAEDVEQNKKVQNDLRSIQKRIAERAISAYRTAAYWLLHTGRDGR